MSKILDKITKDYQDDVLVRIAYHSSAIENNRITLNETITILLEDKMPNSNFSIREFFEVENHRQALDFVWENLESSLDIYSIKKIHHYLLDRLNHERGQFKTQRNAIAGASFNTASVQETPILMQQWIDNTNYRLNVATNDEEKVKIILESHIQFERIHPFIDGNGRTGRLIMLHQFLQNNLVPLIIQKENKREYLDILDNQDVDGFYNLYQKNYDFEFTKLEIFFEQKNEDLER